ncbi:hypothetical protein AMAG_12845 [Allomyces macrogynus ATCC 38327]|uniref:Bulb-type lectin domain-containing protein n=1 Tax=Allomyces macrogynus (strain ATCC 38327) TaxID=578462 RepID=A0A0L0T1P2_ALLM3|nr:hypothetical protein AMAG_12845 [Allomyces macrogynus ATCC 38327]|eukprot:KNE68676.1 hypothetical protein AMAG_12845 [Allomyces macrogynus ATCC 38327]
MDWHYRPMFNYLDSGEFLSSKNNKYHLVMEPSGKLALYNSWLWIPSNQVWSSNSAAKESGAPYTLELNMQRNDSYSVYIRSKSGAIVWDIGVRKVPTLNCLFVSDEGRIVISDFFRCEIFRTFDPVVAPKHKCHGTFEEMVLPYILDAVTTTIQMQEAMLACTSTGGVVKVLTRTVPALALLLTTAETTTYAMLQDLINHVASALVTQKELVKAMEETGGDFTASSTLVKTLELQLDEQRTIVAEAEEKCVRAGQAYEDAQAEYQRQVKKKRDLEIAALAMLWFPLVSAGLGIGVAVSTKDVENARAVLDARKTDVFQQRKRCDDLNARINALFMGKYNAEGRKDMATAHLDGLTAEMEELKMQRDQYATLQEFLHKEGTQIGLAAGTARILELETSGYITMMPLIRMLKELVTNLVATGLVEGQDAKKLTTDMVKIEVAAEKIKRLKIEGSKSLEDFFAPPVEEPSIEILPNSLIMNLRYVLFDPENAGQFGN